MYTLDNVTVSKIYNNLLSEINDKGLVIGFEIHDLNRTLSYYMDTTLSKDKENWIIRKRNVVLTFATSSLAIAEKNNYDHESFYLKYGYNETEMTLTPGAVPIMNDHNQMIGVLTITGLSAEDDHNLALSALVNL